MLTPALGFWSGPFKFCLNALLFLTPLFFWLPCEDVFLLPKRTVFYICLLLAFMAWGLGTLERRAFSWPRTPVLPALLLWLLAGTLSLWASPANPLGLSTWLEWGSYVLVFFLFSSAMEEPGFSGGALSCLLVSSLLMGLYGCLQFFGLDLIDWVSFGGSRILSTVGNPDPLAGQIALVLPVAAALFLAGRQKILSGALFALLSLTFVMTQSKGGFLAIAAAFLFLGAGLLASGDKELLIRNKRYMAGLFIAMLFVPSIFSSLGRGLSLFSHLASLADLNHSSAVIRFFLWKSSILLIHQAPFLGFGPGSFRLLSPMAQSTLWKQGGWNIDVHDEAYAHNDFLQMACEGGLITLGCFILVLGVLFVAGLRRVRARENAEARVLGLGLLSAWVAYLVFSFFHFPLKVACLPVTAMFFAALLTAPGAGYRTVQVPLGLAGKKTLQLLVVFIAMAGIFFSSMDFLGGVEYKAGLQSQQAGSVPDALLHFEKALGYKPKEIGLHFSYALALEAGGRSQEAVEEDLKAIELYPAFIGAWYNLANLYQRHAAVTEGQEAYRNFLQAEKAYLQALNIKPNYVDALNNLGNLYFSFASRMRDTSVTGQAATFYRKAGEQYEKALKYNNACVESHYNLGMVREVQGQMAQARSEWEIVLTLDPHYELALKKMAVQKKHR